jgi:hypothetical protein
MILTVGLAAAAATVAVGVGVANAATTHQQSGSVAAAQAAAATKDADPTDLAHWSDAQRAAATIAGKALNSKLGAVKVLRSGSVGKPNVYVVYLVTPVKGSWNVTVDVATKSVISIANA